MNYKRSRLEIYLDILKAMSKGTNKPTRIMYYSNISWIPLKDILNSLLEQGLVEVKKVKSSSRYYITPKGLRVLGYIKKIQQELVVETIQNR